MAMDFRCKRKQKIKGLNFFLTQCTLRLFSFKFPRQLIFGLHWSEILSNLGHKRAIFGLSKVATFTLFMSASPIATAYGISIPNDPINDSTIVRLQTNSIPPGSVLSPSDNDITNWWVQAGSTGFGSGQSNYFNSGSLEAPVMTPTDGSPELNSTNIQSGTSNVLVTKLPMNGDQVFLSIWLKRQNQSWKRVLNPVITASSSTTTTTKVEDLRNGILLYVFGRYVWSNTSMASHYQVWINDRDGANVHKKWYTHKEVCTSTQAYYPDQCATRLPPDAVDGTFWVRGWNVHGGYGPWSNPHTISFDVHKQSSD